MPQGFRYADDIVPGPAQNDLVEQLKSLPVQAFDFHGFEGKRRVVSYGLRYEFGAERLVQTDPIPDLLLPIRAMAGEFAGIRPDRLRQALVTEYGPGAPIGWHKDKSVFGSIVGISLLSQCVFRLRRKVGSKWERASITARPGSAYLLSGSARTEWEHSIPPVEQTRYSITFRELKS